MTPVRKRWFPLWVGLLFFIGWCVVFAVTVGAEIHGKEVNWDGLVAVLPLLWLVGYGTACALLNHTTVGVSKDGVDVSTGPLPGGGSRKIARNQIKRCYYRLVLVPTRFSNVQNFAVGVEMRDTRRVTLLSDYETIKEASAA